jgi:serine/threonine protein kinase
VVLQNIWPLKSSLIKVFTLSSFSGHGKPVDWWCLGILTYEMIAGIDPFNDEDPMAIYQKILKGKIKFPRDFDK